MRIVTPYEMKMAERESERLGVGSDILMDNAGKQLAKFISEICHEKGFSKVLFMCGKGNNGGDCFVAGRELIYSGYDVTFVNMCGQPATDTAMNAFRKIPEERAKFISGYQSAGLKNDFESAELAFMTGGELYKDSAKRIPSVKELKKQEVERISAVAHAFDSAEIIIDGVFGTGFHGSLDEDIVKWFDYADGKLKIAVDIPSGADCSTGTVSEGTFRADYTAVFGWLKSGMTQYPLRQYCGDVRVFDIGIDERCLKQNKHMEVIESELIPHYRQKRNPASHKGNFGRLLSVTGSDRMRGASVMSSMAALRSGLGLLTVASTHRCIDNLSITAPEAITLPLANDSSGYLLAEPNYRMVQEELEKSTAVLLGCGMGVTANTLKLTEYIIQNAECPVIIDADGINCISSGIDILRKKKAEIILTPHPKEMSGLCGKSVDEIQQNRIETALEFAERYGVTVVLKGAGTVTANAERCMVNITGNAGMSRGGSGDVLAGIISSLAAQGYSPFDACCYGVYIHGLAGDITAGKMGYEAMLPTDVIANLSDSFRSTGK